MNVGKKQLEKISFWSSIGAVGAIIGAAATGVNIIYTMAGILAILSFATLIIRKAVK